MDMVVIEPTPPDSYRDPREGRLASECSHSSPPERGQGWVRSKSIILSLLLILICLPLHAQTNCEDATQIIRLAERDLANRTYERAINRLLDARDICPAKKTQVNALIKKAFQQIEGEKRSAKQAQEEALAQQQRAEQATRKADSSLALANKVLNQLYFYDDKFGLTYKNAAPFPPAEFYRYGYINRRGETVIPFEFEEATAFSNEDGFARVTKFGNRYLLDTLGRTYRLAESLEEITPQTEALHLRGEQMEQLGPFLAEQAELPNLKVLLLYATEEEEPLAQLPAEIDKLSQLTYLDLHGNDQISLPPSIAKLTQMIFLNLSRCGLQRIPPQLASMTELGHLDLSVNEIERFDDIFGSLILLDDLDLSYNPNTAPLPASIWECRILEELRLVDLGLSQLDERIGQLIYLRSLFLDYNNIRALPEEIGALEQLQLLSLAENQISSLPESFARLEQLYGLHLGHNQLTAFPQQLLAMKQLETLYLFNNEIQSMDERCCELSKTFDEDMLGMLFSSNPVPSIPDCWIDKLSESRLVYYAQESMAERNFSLALQLFGVLEGRFAERFDREKKYYLDDLEQYTDDSPEYRRLWEKLQP